MNAFIWMAMKAWVRQDGNTRSQIILNVEDSSGPLLKFGFPSLLWSLFSSYIICLWNEKCSVSENLRSVSVSHVITCTNQVIIQVLASSHEDSSLEMFPSIFSPCGNLKISWWLLVDCNMNEYRIQVTTSQVDPFSLCSTSHEFA